MLYPLKNAYQNYDHEISAVIEWIKEKKSKKQHRLLIMSPALEKLQVKLQNALIETFNHLFLKIYNQEAYKYKP